MNRSIIYLLFSFICLTSMANEKPKATLKAQYDFVTQSLNTKTGKRSPFIRNYVLQMAPRVSYYYDTRTFYVDSMENDPQGKIILDQARDAAYRAFGEDHTKDPFKTLEEQGFVRNSRYKCLKDFNKNSIRVWDSQMGDKYRYDVDMADLTWDLGDSTKTVMGYECQLATTDYHGRRCEAWFAPNVPVQDGPWQLCGLPGLIMEASCEGGLYSFHITGLQQCNEALKPTFEDDSYYIIDRKAVLKMRDYSRKNRAAQINAMTGGKVKLSNSVNAKEDSDDLIETDYH